MIGIHSVPSAIPCYLLARPLFLLFLNMTLDRDPVASQLVNYAHSQRVNI